MKKRFLNLFLALALVVCVLPMAANAATCTHVWKYKAPVAATCTTDGWKGGDACEACNAPRTASNVIPATHTWQKKDAFAATCTSAGWKGGDACKICDAPRNESNVIPAAHTWQRKAAVAATCTTAGWKGGDVCKVCDAPRNESNVIPATGNHDYQFFFWAEKGKEATCTESAVAVYKCSVCGGTANKTVNALEHDYDYENPVETVVTKANCTTNGLVRRKCSRCDETKDFTVEKLSATGNHDYEVTGFKKDSVPTCTTAGLKILKCKVCGGTTSRTADALGHDYDYENPVETVITKATCTENGTVSRKCSRCTETKNFTVEKLSATGKHTYELDFWAKEGEVATCEKDAIGVFECAVCGDRENITVYALGHDWDITVLKEAACTVKGMEFHACKREGCAVWKYVEIAELGHNKVVVDAVAPTCTATGLTAGEKCSACGEVFTAQTVVEKIPHAWEDIEAQAATCKADGYNAHKACTECGETDGKSVIPASASNHEYVDFKCKHCGTYDPSHKHEGTGVITTESTCTAEGVKTFECDDCDHTWTEAVAKKPHTYNAKARCTECGALDSAHQHNYVQTAYRQPTCTVEGKVTKKCSVCDDLNETIIDSTGHSYVDGKCTGCGIAAACEHANTTTTVVSDATCNRAGQKVTTCDNCGKTVGTEVIPATGNHNFVNNRCTGCGKNNPNRLTIDFQDVFIVG